MTDLTMKRYWAQLTRPTLASRTVPDLVLITEAADRIEQLLSNDNPR